MYMYIYIYIYVYNFQLSIAIFVHGDHKTSNCNPTARGDKRPQVLGATSVQPSGSQATAPHQSRLRQRLHH